jgi:eukaryotic-like serine/threonine-protein kinase
MTTRWVGEYEIVKRLRVGGMATLYLARRHGAAGFSRLVALKVIQPDFVEQSQFIDMFVDEARICSRISHPNVVYVEEFGEIDGVHYLVMEYLDGCSISELLQVFRREGRKLDPELAARVIMQIAGGLHAAHETLDTDGEPLELVHRDVSPSNILLSADGNPKLIDFGIAKARNRLAETEAGVALKGKFKYIAPEQAMRATVDRRGDIFSLGVVFWEMLVGQPPFPDDTHAALFKRLHQTDVAAPSTVNPDSLVVLDAIVLSMLRHDPAERPQTAAEVQRRIAFALPGAANREASELGAIAIEVRDKRAARRIARGENDSDSNASFSPTPRSRPETAGYRVEIQTSPTVNIDGTDGGTGARGTLPPAPQTWRQRSVQVGVLGLLAVGLTVGVLVGRHGGGTSNLPAPSRQAAPADPRSAGARAGIEQAPGTRAEPPVPPMPTSAPPSPGPPAIADEAPPPPVPIVRPPQAVSAKQREAARVIAKPRPTRRAPEPEVAKPARAVANHSGKLPSSDAPFDDSDHTGNTGPNREKVEPTPIVIESATE